MIDANTPKHVTHSPGQAPISGGQNLIFVYSEEGNVILRYEDHKPASLVSHPVSLPTHIRQFLSSFLTCYLPYVGAATNNTYPNKVMSVSTNTYNSLLLFQFPNNVRSTGRGKRRSWRKSFIFCLPNNATRGFEYGHWYSMKRNPASLIIPTWWQKNPTL